MGCVSCKDQTIPEVAETIRQACTMLVQGHMGVSSMYEQLAQVIHVPADKALFLEAMEKHKRMALESADVVLPDITLSKVPEEEKADG